MGLAPRAARSVVGFFASFVPLLLLILPVPQLRCAGLLRLVVDEIGIAGRLLHGLYSPARVSPVLRKLYSGPPLLSGGGIPAPTLPYLHLIFIPALPHIHLISTSSPSPPPYFHLSPSSYPPHLHLSLTYLQPTSFFLISTSPPSPSCQAG